MSDEKKPAGPKERPILFSGAMVRAILTGQKTQTRRALRVQPEVVDTRVAYGVRTWVVGKEQFWPPGVQSSSQPGAPHPRAWGGPEHLALCPYGNAGDRLWVRTTWAVAACYDHLKPTAIDGASADPFWHAGETGVPRDRGKLRPGRFWPLTLRHRCPATLEIVSVRVERLQDISEADARAEGVESINGDESWTANPWVWVVTFKRLEVSRGQ